MHMFIFSMSARSAIISTSALQTDAVPITSVTKCRLSLCSSHDTYHVYKLSGSLHDIYHINY